MLGRAVTPIQLVQEALTAPMESRGVKPESLITEGGHSNWKDTARGHHPRPDRATERDQEYAHLPSRRWPLAPLFPISCRPPGLTETARRAAIVPLRLSHQGRGRTRKKALVAAAWHLNCPERSFFSQTLSKP